MKSFLEDDSEDEANTGNVLHGPPTRRLDQIVLQVRARGQIWAVERSMGRPNSNG